MKHAAFVWLVLAGMAVPSFALKRITAAQLEQMVATLHGKPDAETAFRIADVELTERLAAARIERLSAALPGEKSRQALTAIADASEFQPPPPEEIPTTAPPDLATQRHIMGLVVAYVTRTVPQLPNFIATRITDSFEDSPLVAREHAVAIPYEPLHFVGRSQVTAAYRNNREVEDPVANENKQSSLARQGLSSTGEFGPILSTTLQDAAQSKLEWLRWEQGDAGIVAVFAYAVPKEKSHFALDYCCVADSEGRTHNVHELAGYQGQMAVDPASGVILWLQVIADLKSGQPIISAKIAVNYAPVDIVGKTYICPVHSIALSRGQSIAMEKQEMVQAAAHGRQGMGLAPVVVGTATEVSNQTLLNDTLFTQYHVFRAETRVIAGTAPDLPPLGAPPVQPAASEVTSAPPGPATADAAFSSLHAIPAATEPANASDSTSAAAAMPVPAPPPVPEISEAAATGLPDIPANSPEPQPNGGFRLRTTTRLVDVGLVAYDKKGHPVTDLQQGDFELCDNGRRQEIKYFGQASQSPASLPAAQSTQAADAAPETVYSNRQTSPALRQRTAPQESHATILLIDASNLAWGDLQYARQEMLRFLKTLAADEPVGVYILRSYGFQILLEPTTDHAQVSAQLSRWMPSAQDLARAQWEEQKNRQHIDWVLHASDLAYVNGNDGSDPTQSYSGTGQAAAASNSVDPQLRSMGSNPQRDALERLQVIARHLAAIPGHKSLVLVSSDNALADWSSQAAGREDKGHNFIDALWLRAREALNEAHVSIYPLDASQLEAGVITADLENRLIQAKLPPKPGDPPPPPPNPTGRYAAQMHQDTHAIQPEFRELAEATGGRALRRAGDIAAELSGIADDGRAAYLLSFTPDQAADDRYHTIAVKLPGRHDLTLRYRTGYLYEKDPATLKERFHQAVWQARDVTDIALTATPNGTGKERGLKLNIAATDLAMAQAGDRWTDTLQVFLIESDDATVQAKFTGRRLGLRLQPATYERVLREGIVVDAPMPPKPPAGSLRIVVVDENSGRMGSLTIPASVAAGENH